MKNNYYAVIMAGGGGTRLWPLSTQAHPKQMLKIINNRSLFQIAIDRLRDIFQLDQIFVVTGKDQVNELLAHTPELKMSNFLIEPLPRGTASVVGLAAIHLLNKDQNAVMAVLTADHVIRNVDCFHELLENAYKLAESDYLVTLGIQPTYPATGYGYIKAGSALDDCDAFIVERFIEKPQKELAEKLIQYGGYFWNSGMFIWRADRILHEFAIHLPSVYDKLMAISYRLGMPDIDQYIHEVWPLVEKQTIDYGIMEKAEEVVVLPGNNLQWGDVGSWDSLQEVLDSDENGNIIRNCHEVLIDSQNLTIFADNPEKVVAVIGIEDLIIVDCGKSLLICKKGNSQRVKEIIDELTRKNLDAYL